MSFWTYRDGWPADRINHVFLLRAVDKVGATLFGEWWCPPSQGPFEGRKTARRVAKFGKAWLATERFRDVRTLMAKACEAGQLQAVYLNNIEPVPMGTREWLGDVNTYFEQGHIFLPNGTFPIFVREPSLDHFIAGLTPVAATPPDGESAPVTSMAETSTADVQSRPRASRRRRDQGGGTQTIRARAVLKRIWPEEYPTEEHVSSVDLYERFEKEFGEYKKDEAKAGRSSRYPVPSKSVVMREVGRKK
jgi:hypothetical protein